jgi:hypothetical protein
MSISKERLLEIENEAKRRLDLWLQNTTFEEMTVGFSMVRFNMALGLLNGYPFQKEKWMTDFDSFVTEDEWSKPEYDNIMNNLFYEALKKNN